MRGTANLDAQQRHANHAPAANTAAVVTLTPAEVEERIVVDKLTWSYDATPTGGRLTISIGGTVVHDFSITNAGPGFDFWPRGLEAQPNEAVVVTLTAAGASATGKLNVSYR